MENEEELVDYEEDNNINESPRAVAYPTKLVLNPPTTDHIVCLPSGRHQEWIVDTLLNTYNASTEPDQGEAKLTNVNVWIVDHADGPGVSCVRFRSALRSFYVTGHL